MTDEEYRARRKKLMGMAARGEIISWCSHCLGERKDANSPILHLPDCPYAEVQAILKEGS